MHNFFISLLCEHPDCRRTYLTRSLIITAVLSLLPISELRGAIPYALTRGVPVGLAVVLSVVLNALVGPFVHVFLSTIHKLFLRMRWYEHFFGVLIEGARKKLHGKVERFGYWGVMIFVAIPLPVTGAYTGTLGAWVLGLERKKTFIAVAAGVCIAGAIVTTVSLLGIEAFSIFIKGR